MKDGKAIGKWQRKEIKNIMKYFDFQKVQNVMRLLDWRWQDAKVPPSITELKESARTMLEDMVSKEHGFDFCDSSCGGFHVEYNEKSERLDLFFCIAQSL